jgi:hypothetical protein
VSAALAKLPPAVTFLDLSSNALTGSLGSTVCGMAAGGLEALYLGGNPITGSLPACLLSNGAPSPREHAIMPRRTDAAFLGNVDSVSMTGGHLGLAGSALVSLDVSGCGLSGGLPGALAGGPAAALQYLSLSQNGLTGAPVPRAGGLPPSSACPLRACAARPRQMHRRWGR